MQVTATLVEILNGAIWFTEREVTLSFDLSTWLSAMGFMFNLSVRRPCAAIWLWIALVLLLWNGRGVVLDSKYLIGLGSYDITGLAADVNMMGYANKEQIASGVHFRL